MMYSDNEIDNFLKIKTSGRDDSEYDFINYPYEPTPYSVLQTLVNSGHIVKKDKIVDFGCGKGRVDFFLAFNTKAQMIGVELSERLFKKAIENKQTAIRGNRVEFFNCCASKFNIDNDITGAYFFNPFAVSILVEVVKNLKESKKQNNREIKLFFYYPSKEYLSYLESDSDLVFCEKFDCKNQFKEEDEREYIAVYKL